MRPESLGLCDFLVTPSLFLVLTPVTMPLDAGHGGGVSAVLRTTRGYGNTGARFRTDETSLAQPEATSWGKPMAG